MMKRHGRKRHIRYRYRPGGRRPSFGRRVSSAANSIKAFFTGSPLGAVRALLAAAAAVSLFFAAAVIVRSVRTAALNRSLAAMYASVPEAAAVSGEAEEKASGGLRLSQMVLPDGTPIDTTASGIYHLVSSYILPGMRSPLRHNPDTVGWLTIPDIVDLPVVYRDNTYYLTHDFYGNTSRSGTLFLDEHHPLDAGARNLLIYGHNMHDGSMFGLLTHYRRLERVKTHPLISFSTLWEKETYAVFAVVRTPDDPADPGYLDFFCHPGFASAAAFEDYIGAVRARSLFDIPVEVSPEDPLLTLATCMDTGHLTVFARRLRPGESADAVASAVLTGARQNLPSASASLH